MRVSLLPPLSIHKTLLKVYGLCRGEGSASFLHHHIPAWSTEEFGRVASVHDLLGRLSKQPSSPWSSLSVFKSSRGAENIPPLACTAAELSLLRLLQPSVAALVCCALKTHFSSIDYGPMAAQFQNCAFMFITLRSCRC